jgi:preprotein translocase subunit SecF
MAEKDKFKKKIFKETKAEKPQEEKEAEKKIEEKKLDVKEITQTDVKKQETKAHTTPTQPQPAKTQTFTPKIQPPPKPTPKPITIKFFSIFPYGKIINFLKFRKIAYAISSALFAFSLFVILSGRVPLSTDFKGGVSANIKYEGEGTIDVGKIREVFGGEGNIQSIGINEFLIKLPLDFVEKAKAEGKDAGTAIIEKLEKIGKFKIEKVESVGSLIGAELRKKGIYAVIFSIIGISIYIVLRFEWRFAVGAAISLFHDSLITLGIASILGVELSLPTLAAILTLIGYSINDSIIIADRIREKLRIARIAWTEDIFNRAISETLTRTIITALTILFPTLTITIFGTTTLRDIGIIFLIGLVVGTYSSIFVVSSLAYDIYTLQKKMKENKTQKITQKA